MLDYDVMREKMPYEKDLYRDLQMIEERGRRLKEARRNRFTTLFIQVRKNIGIWAAEIMLKIHMNLRR